jgi:hypothetical protein
MSDFQNIYQLGKCKCVSKISKLGKSKGINDLQNFQPKLKSR